MVSQIQELQQLLETNLQTYVGQIYRNDKLKIFRAVRETLADIGSRTTAPIEPKEQKDGSND